MRSIFTTAQAALQSDRATAGEFTVSASFHVDQHDVQPGELFSELALVICAAASMVLRGAGHAASSWTCRWLLLRVRHRKIRLCDSDQSARNGN